MFWGSARRPHLTCALDGVRLAVTDGREKPEDPRTYEFEGAAALAYEFCGYTYHGAVQVLAHLRDEHGIDTDLDAVQGDLDRLAELGLMLAEDGHYLSLGLPRRA